MKTTVATIDFGTSKIVTLVAENSGSQRCDIVAAGIAKYDGYLDEGWNNPQELDTEIRQSLADAEEQSGTKIREINVGVPGAFTRVYATKVTVPLKGTDPRVTSQDVKTAFKMAAENLEEAVRAKELFEGKTIVIPIKVGGAGRAFGAVQAKEIADAAAAQFGVEIDRKKLVLPGPIKELGTYDIPLKLHPDVPIKLHVEITKLQ